MKQTSTESVLVFTRTKHRAKRLGEKLSKVGYKAASLQGNLSQNRRQAALKGFRDGSVRILVATDIAARGIDVSQISHVVNFDIPDTPEAYIHRIGRTGRAARTGDAFTMVTAEDKQMVRAIEKALDQQIERRMLDDFDYKVPAPKRNSQPARSGKTLSAGKPSAKASAKRRGSGVETAGSKPQQRRQPSRRRRPQANRPAAATTASH